MQERFGSSVFRVMRPKSPRSALALLVAGTAVGLAVAYQVRARLESEREAPVAAAYALRAETIMATRIEVLMPHKHRHDAKIVFESFRQVDARMSEWKPSSPLSAINRSAGKKAVSVPDDLRTVIASGLALSELTEGAFDITWAALWGLWDFKPEQPRVPPAQEVERRRELVNYRDVRVDETAGTVFLKRKGMKIGLGAIAKGFALNLSAARLRQKGLTSFMLSSGGQILVGGKKGDRPWRVGIRDPRGAPTDYFATLTLEDTSASTSGDYERFFIRDGIRYHHVLDPRTGMPSRGARSATVICKDAAYADALSTAIMIMGHLKGLGLVNRLEGVEAVVVDTKGRVHMSSGAQPFVVTKHPPHQAASGFSASSRAERAGGAQGSSTTNTAPQPVPSL